MTTQISQDALNKISSGQPSWLTTQRRAAFQAFEKLPLPSRRDVDWQRFDPAVRDALNLDKISLPLNGTRSITETLTPLPADLSQKGVVFCDIATALKKHGDLVREYLGKSTPLGRGEPPGKFEALHAAFWNAGAFLFVPRGVQVTVPLEVTYQFQGKDVAGFPHTLVVVEQGAEATLVQKFIGGTGVSPVDQKIKTGGTPVPLSQTPSTHQPINPSLHASGTEVFVKEGGRLHYISLQNFDKSVFDFTVKRAHIARDAEIDWVVGMFGAAFQRYDIECVMEGEGGTSFMYGVGVGDDRQQFGQFTKQHHTTGNTVSDLMFKNVLRDHAVSNYAGLIKVEKNANGTNAYQSNKNLVLSDGVKCDTRPILEIESNQLRCTHGATVGRLDENQIYYLRARGLDEMQAKQMLIEAFLEPVLARIKVESVYKEFAELVHNKVTQ
jgi:Fe-S cluster assembly protein SufD